MNHYTKYIKTLTLSLFILTGCRDYNQFDGDKYAPVGDETDGTGGSYTWLNPTTPKEKFSFRTDWDNTAAASTTKIQHYALFYYKDADNWKLFHELTSTLDDYNYGKTAPIDLGALKTIVDNPAFNSSSKVNNYENPTTLKIFDITFKTDRKMNSTTINRRFRSTGLTSEYDLYIVEGYPTSLPSTTTYLRAHYNFSEIFDKYKTFVPSDLTFFVTAPSLIPPDPYKDEIFKARLENIDLTSTVVAKYRDSLDDSSGFTPFTHGSTTPPAYLPEGIKTIIKSATAPKFNSITANKVSMDLIATDLTHTIPPTTDYGAPSKDFDYTIDNGTFFLVITDSPLIPTKTLIQYKYTIRDYDDTDGIYKQYIPRDIYVNVASDERSDEEKFKDRVRDEYVYEKGKLDKAIRPIGQFDTTGANFISDTISETGDIAKTTIPITSATSATKAIYGDYTFDLTDRANSNIEKTGSRDIKIIVQDTKISHTLLHENIISAYPHIFNLADVPVPLGYFDSAKYWISRHGPFKAIVSDPTLFKFTMDKDSISQQSFVIYNFDTLDKPQGKLNRTRVTMNSDEFPRPTPLVDTSVWSPTLDLIGTLADGTKYTEEGGKTYTLVKSWKSTDGDPDSDIYVYKNDSSFRVFSKHGEIHLYKDFVPTAITVTFLSILDYRISLLEPKLADFVYAKDGSWKDFSIVDRKYTVSGITYTITAINASIDTVTTDGGTHRLIGEQYGVAPSGTIPFGTEIAIKPSSSDDITDLIGKLVDFVSSTPSATGTWNLITTSLTGYTLNGLTYEIGKIYSDNTILVANNSSGTETHRLKDPKSLIKVDGDTEIAFKKATEGEALALIGKLVDFVSSTPSATGTWNLITTSLTGYTLNGLTYEIGKIYSDNTILVANNSSGTETHRLKDPKSLIKVDGDTEIAFKKATTLEALALIGKLEGFVGAIGIGTSDWGNPWKALIEDKTDSVYKIDDVIYKIGKIYSDNTILVANNSGVVETHRLKDPKSLIKVQVDGDTEIAFKQATKEEVAPFIARLKDEDFVESTSFASVVDYSGSDIAYYFTLDPYYIGKIIDKDTVFIMQHKQIGKHHKIIDGRLKEHISLDEINSGVEIAFKRVTETEVTTFLKDFITYSSTSSWIPLEVETSYSPNSIYYTLNDRNDYHIYKIEGNTVHVKNDRDEVKEHKKIDYKDKDYVDFAVGSDGMPQAVRRNAVDRDGIKKYAEKINKKNLKYQGTKEDDLFIISDDGKYKDDTGKGEDDVQIGQIRDGDALVSSFGVRHGLNGNKYGILNDDGTITVIADK